MGRIIALSAAFWLGLSPALASDFSGPGAQFQLPPVVPGDILTGGLSGYNISDSGLLPIKTYIGATNPTAATDSTQGYSVGSTGINTATGAVFVAKSVSPAAAVWTQLAVATATTKSTFHGTHGTYSFTAQGTSTLVHVYGCGGGGSGGSGALEAASVAVSGGGGGGGGGCLDKWIAAASLSGAQTLTIGAGGASVAGQTTSTTAGLNGNAGTATCFAGSTVNNSLLCAGPGGGGAGGQLAATTSGGGGGGSLNVNGVSATGASGGAGGNFGAGAGGTGASSASYSSPFGGTGGSGTSAAGVAGAQAGSSTTACPGGGAGGGLSATDTANNGGAGGLSGQAFGSNTSPAAGGTSGTINGGSITPTSGVYFPGLGGGGGYGTTGTAGSGGAGTQCAGGGGGGSAENGGTAGASGAGGDGWLEIDEF
jgi:hypothetical protein